MLSGRLTETGALFGINKELPEGVEAELKQLYYDMANSTHTAAFSALTTVAPISHVVFGTDYPFIPMRATAGGLSKLGLGAADLQSIRRDNALRLFPRLKTATT
jgi:6-methylsalicylate decarboxylase